MKKRASNVGTYGNTGREFYRVHERAAAQRRAAWTITILVVFILAVVIIGAVAR
jgi:type IV secretory pathway component VirB8